MPTVSTKNSFTRDELILAGHGELFGPNAPRLPLPNMLMIDRVVEGPVERVGGGRVREKRRRGADGPRVSTAWTGSPGAAPLSDSASAGWSAC